MAQWHDPACRRLDVACVGTFLSCMSCGSVGSLEEMKEKSSQLDNQLSLSGLSLDLSPPTSVRPLSWPASVDYLSKPSATDLHRLLREIKSNTPLVEATNSRVASALGHEYRLESNLYVYPDLTKSTHIRLLHLSPGSRMETLHGRLEVVDWNSRPSYGALSYTWADAEGDAALCRRIFLGDSYKPLPITLNCDRALRCLRKRGAGAVLWVDAICIDQSSSKERSHQVSLMNQIYSLAETVHVYVGEEQFGEDDTGNMAMKTLEATGTFDESLEARVLGRFFDRPYFSRLWVVQEFLLARSINLHCGELSLQLTKERIARIENKTHQFPSWIGLMARDGPNPEMAFGDLASLLAATSGCEVSDLRDKVFGLLGLVKDAGTGALQADYSLMVREVYIGVAAHLMKLGHRHILEYTYKENHADLRSRFGIPSWVPLWNHSAGMSRVEDSATQRQRLLEQCGAYAEGRNHKVEIFGPGGLEKMHYKADDSIHNAPAHLMEVHDETGALITAGYTVLELASPPFGVTNTAFRDAEKLSEGSGMSTELWTLPSGALLGVRALSVVLQANPRHSSSGPFQVVGIAGCATFFLAVKAHSTSRKTSYRLLSPCSIALVLWSDRPDPLGSSDVDRMAFLEQLNPLLSRHLRFLVQWRQMLLAEKQAEEAAASKCSPKDLPRWYSDPFQTEEYKEFDRLASTAIPDNESCLLKLLEFWEGADMNHVSRLISTPLTLDISQVNYNAWCRALSFLNNAARQDFELDRFAPSRTGSTLKWSARFQEMLEDWRRETTTLGILFHNLAGIEFRVQSNGLEVLVTGELADEICDRVLSYPAQCQRQDDVIRMLATTKVVGDANWDYIDGFLHNILHKRSRGNPTDEAREVKRLLRSRDEFEHMFTASRRPAEMVFV